MHKCKCHPQEFFRKTQEAEHQHTGKESLLCAAVSSVFFCCNFFKGHKIRKVHWNCLSLFPFPAHNPLRVPLGPFEQAAVESGLKKHMVEKVFSKLITTGRGLWKAALFVSGPFSIKRLIQTRSAHLEPRWAGRRTMLNTSLKDALVAVCCFSSKWWNNIWSSRINMMKANGPEGRNGVMPLGSVNGALVWCVYRVRWPSGRLSLGRHLASLLLLWHKHYTKGVGWSGNDIRSILSWSWQTVCRLWLNIACKPPRSGLWAAPYVMETRLMIQTKTKSRKKAECY